MHREGDESIPFLPEEKNPVFYIYPVCIVTSLIFAILWLSTNIFMKKPQIVLIGCFIAAALLLSAGITEMKHADMYLDLTKIRDEDLLNHPIFIHNFIMCLVSIFGMTIYLIQGWILVDYWAQVKKQTNDYEISDSSEDSDINEDHRSQKSKWKSKNTEEPGELDPIPALEKFPSLMSMSQPEVIFVIFNYTVIHLIYAFNQTYDFCETKNVTNFLLNYLDLVKENSITKIQSP